MSLQAALRGEAMTLRLLEDALRGDLADQVELVLETRHRAVTRFAQNEIHQNVTESDTRLAARAIIGQAGARSFANDPRPEAVRATIAAAAASARLQPSNPNFVGLPAPLDRAATPQPPLFFAATADQTAADRASLIRALIEPVAAAGFAAFGTAITEVVELTVVNSLGIRAYAATTSAYLRVLADNGEGTGYADALVSDVRDLDPAALAAEAIWKCRLNRDQITLPPGDYACVLEPDCVADFVRFPVLAGLSAVQVEQGSSFMAGKFGQPVTGPLVTLRDDPSDPRCLPMPIDYEGLPAQPIDLIVDGIARDVATDHATATRRARNTGATQGWAGASPATDGSSNGHAASPWEDDLPLPEHVIMAGGSATTDELTAHLDRGLRITRLHYTHSPDPKRVVATGTTRDGTFLVEHGQIVAAVKNLRFTMSVLDLLASIEELGQTKTCRDWWAANGMGTTTYVLPALRVGRCTFTGVTTF